MQGGLINDVAKKKRIPLLIVDYLQAIEPGSQLI
jgi:hypothetical protein